MKKSPPDPMKPNRVHYLSTLLLCSSCILGTPVHAFDKNRDGYALSDLKNNTLYFIGQSFLSIENVLEYLLDTGYLPAYVNVSDDLELQKVPTFHETQAVCLLAAEETVDLCITQTGNEGQEEEREDILTTILEGGPFNTPSINDDNAYSSSLGNYPDLPVKNLIKGYFEAYATTLTYYDPTMINWPPGMRDKSGDNSIEKVKPWYFEFQPQYIEQPVIAIFPLVRGTRTEVQTTSNPRHSTLRITHRPDRCLPLQRRAHQTTQSPPQ